MRGRPAGEVAERLERPADGTPGDGRRVECAVIGERIDQCIRAGKHRRIDDKDQGAERVVGRGVVGLGVPILRRVRGAGRPALPATMGIVRCCPETDRVTC